MRDKALSLGIDLGTTSCKMCLLAGSGDIAATASCGYSTNSPHSGWAEQDPNDWLTAVQKTSRELQGKTRFEKSHIDCIVLTSAAHIGVLLDDGNRAVRNALLWSDQRSKKEAALLDSSHGEKIFQVSFNRASTSWTLPHLLWLKNNEPALWQSTKRIALSKDYLLYHLVGEWITDPGTAVSAMLCDAIRLEWSEKLCGLAGISPQILPRIMGAGDVVGKLSREGASLLGLPQGVPVINGTLDSATETFGAGAVRPGEFVIRIGTAGGIHRIKSKPLPDERLLTYPYLMDELWYSQAGTNSAGSAISWALQAAGIKPGPGQFERMGQTALQAPAGCNGLLFHPFLSGERTPYWDPELRGAFTGLSFRHARQHFARAVLEGVVFSLYDAFSALAGGGEIPEVIKVVGGGACDPVLMAILSSVMNREIHAGVSVDSAYGAALFGLHCLGASDHTRNQESQKGAVYKPNAGDAGIYQRAFAVYKKYAGHLQKMYADD
jgi:xylulokinase